ncbi:MAG: ABC transporter permease [Gammaproteobacteria bacterium]|nr:ABC transporter permease [Gammaproteobacteria bacterium]
MSVAKQPNPPQSELAQTNHLEWFKHNWDRTAVPAIFIIMVLVFYLLNPNYLSTLNIINILNQVSILAIVTVGASVVVFGGGFDLSAGSVLALSAVVGSMVIAATGSITLGVMAGTAAGAAVGLLNGFVVGYLNVSPLIVTLGSMNVARGLAFIVSGGIAIHNLPALFSDFAITRTLGVPNLALGALVVFVIVHLVLKYTPYGLNVYAAGGNPVASRLSGVNVAWTKCMTYVISGACAGLAGMLLAARTNGGEPGAGILYELEAIAAVVLGGAALHGGEGRLWRSMMAILLLTALGNGLNIVGIHHYWKGVVIGGILIFAASLDAVKRRHR